MNLFPEQKDTTQAPQPTNQLAQKAADNIAAQDTEKKADHKVEIKPAAEQQQPTESNLPAVKEPTQSERFQMAIEKQFSADNGAVVLTRFQKSLIRSYFIKIDMILKAAETKRLKSTYKQDPLPFTWANVNMPKLAIDVVAWSSIGLDPMQPNHLNPIPYKNTATSKYDFTFIIGYRGTEIKSRKYGLSGSIPDDVVVQVVYKNDKFRPIRKDKNNPIDTYEFSTPDEFIFNRGEIVGGFTYKSFDKAPHKNELRVWSMADINKRKPEYASPEFWGGEKDVWEWDEEKNKKVKKGKEQVEGWQDEMVYKTMFRAAWNSITVDAEKIDDHYQEVLMKENEWRDKVLINVQHDIDEIGNKKPLEITGHSEPAPAAEAASPAKQVTPPVQESTGPGF